MRKNEFIQTGYRLGHTGFKDALLSAFSWHNETTNIWSHFLPCLMYILILISLAETHKSIYRNGYLNHNELNATAAARENRELGLLLHTNIHQLGDEISNFTEQFQNATSELDKTNGYDDIRGFSTKFEKIAKILS